MNLIEQCRKITLSDRKPIEESLKAGEKFFAAGFMDDSQGVHQYPFHFPDRHIYLYIWDFQQPRELRTGICPYSEDVFFRCHFEDGQTAPAHIQDFIELAYVVKGELHQKILDKDIVFQEGDLCLIDHNCKHQDYLHDGSSLVLFLCMRTEVLPHIMDENIPTQKLTRFLQTALMEQKESQQYVHFKPVGNVDEEMQHCFSMLATEINENKAGAKFITKGLLMRIFRLLSTRYEFQLSKQQKQDMSWAVFSDICHYIENNYKTVTIQELSDVFHFQEDYFNRLIKKRTGKTYCELLQDVRLFKAEQLLSLSHMTISEIAEEVGYRNKGYFYKLFSEKYHMTPAEYRRNL